MKSVIKGIEALSAGLAKSGVTRFESATTEWTLRSLETIRTEKLKNAKTESLPYAEEAIGGACFFSEHGEKTACLIMEEQVYRLVPALESSTRTGAALLFIVFGDEKFRYMNIVSAYNVNYRIAYSPGDVLKMVQDAFRYSEAYGRPAVLYVPVRILVSSMCLEVKRTVGNRAKDRCTVIQERKKHESMFGYNSMTGNGDYLIAANSDIAELVLDKVKNRKDVAVVKLDMIYTHMAEQLPLYFKRLLLIEKSKALAYREMEEKRCKRVLLSNNFFEWEKEIERALYGFLKSGIDDSETAAVRNGAAPDYDEEEDPLKIRRPETGYADNIMCPGCIYRKRILEILDNSEHNSYHEEFFCTMRMSYVRSGIMHERSEFTENMQASELIISNRDMTEYHGHGQVIMIDDICRRDGNIFPEKIGNGKFMILEKLCDGCGKCMKISGCPAVWKRGLKVYIDSVKCSGCGLCEEICERGAVVYEQ
ncbi:MAG: 4Fe-4S binding protein [Lachnospiraceae bacterium]|nr:4Fe-4S binding protein [Candidatus Darwinimomas equi]